MSVKLYVLIAFGIYVFIALSVYFIICLIDEDDEDEDMENISIAIFWPLLLIIGIIYTPFWVMRESAKYIRRGIKMNKEKNDD